jgi:hypothetical protein
MQSDFSKSYIRLILNFFVGCIILLSASLTYTQIGLGLTPVTICLFSALPFLFIYILVKRLKINLYFVDLFLFILTSMAFFSQIWTIDSHVWSNNFFWYLICILTFYLVRFSTVERNDYKLIVFFCYISIVFNFFKIVFDQSLDESASVVRHAIEGININFTAYSLVATLYIYILIHKFKFVSSRIVFLLFNLTTLFLVFLLQTRGALISIFLMWFWLLLSSKNFIKIKYTYIYVLFFLGFAVTLGWTRSLLLLLDLYFFKERSTGDLSGRSEQWDLAYDVIKDNPILGIGIGSFESTNPNGIGVHNFYLNIMLELGFIGLLIHLLCFISLFSKNFKVTTNNNVIFVLGLFLSFILSISLSGSWQLAPILWISFAITFNILWVNKNV